MYLYNRGEDIKEKKSGTYNESFLINELVRRLMN